jgi:UDP-N-acetylglucosamine--dolichyl-phosphate N-acetylglucosaminephosphotransferase
MGVVAAAIYLITLFTFIPLPFYDLINTRTLFAGLEGLPNIEWFSLIYFKLYKNIKNSSQSSVYINLLAILAGIVSICTAVLLGFADDVLDLRWRHKLLFPTLSSLPLLLVYLLSGSIKDMILM